MHQMENVQRGRTRVALCQFFLLVLTQQNDFYYFVNIFRVLSLFLYIIIGIAERTPL